MKGVMVDQLFLTIRTAIRWFGAAVIAYIAFQAISTLAGRSTSVLVNATLHAFADLRVVVPTALAAIAGGGWYRERRLRHKNTEHMGERIKQLETNIDKKRTSSKLTKQGKTRPQDKEA